MFDGILDAVLPYVPDDKRQEVITKVYLEFAESDWDTEADSKYYPELEPLLRKLHPEWDWYE